MNRPKVLVVDDKENFLSLFQRLVGDTMEVTGASDGTRALALITHGAFDVVVSDIRMPGADGFALLREAKQVSPDVEVILMTAFGSVADAVRAMKLGAYDYLIKPFDPDEALLLLERAIERKRLREQARDLRVALDGLDRFEGLVGKSPGMQRIFQLLHRAAGTDATVLVTGESGTGKELVARAIHYAGGRAGRRFIPVNCAALPEPLIESELFGHMKGSFTGAFVTKRGLFEEASGGTIFLDEIGELPLAAQVKLTRVLQERVVRKVGSSDELPIDVRVVAATNADLSRAIAEGRFREDLYYRLNVFPIHTMPLRERREDIPGLAALFLDRLRAARSTAPQGFSPEALEALVAYDWPGNVRQLENTIERAVAVSDAARIETDALSEEIFESARPPTELHGRIVDLPFRDAVALARDRASREYLTELMAVVGGNVTLAAERAGMERESLHRLMRRYGVRSDDFRER